MGAAWCCSGRAGDHAGDTGAAARDDAGNRRPVCRAARLLAPLAHPPADIEAREAWRERILRNAQATSQQKSAADGELAMLYHAFQLYAGAEQLYLRVLETTPEHRWGAHDLAQLYRSTNRLEESVGRFTEALGLSLRRRADPRPSSRGVPRFGSRGGSRAAARKGVSLSPETAAVHYYLGQIAAARGQPDLATARFERALELQPSSTALHSPLGLAYRDQGRLEEARKHLAAAGTVDIALDDPLMERLHALSQTLWELLRDAGEKLDQGDREGAIAALDQAAAIDTLGSGAAAAPGSAAGDD